VLHGDFIIEVARKCREEGISVAVETNMYHVWAKLEPVLKEMDLIMCDFKHMECVPHHHWTGVDNQLIINNIGRASLLGIPMIVRTPLIPGANYNFVVEAADNRTVLNNRVSYQTKASENFSEFKFISENVTFGILKTPEDADWRTTPVNPESFTHTFAVGDSATLVLQSTTDVYLPSNKINGLFVFRDSYGNVLPDMTVENTYIWKEIWFEGDKKVGEIEIPRLPTIPGNYTMEIYFNGSFVTKTDIAITG
jgi:hypothetical protein